MLTKSCATYLSILPNKSISSAPQRLLNKVSTKCYLVVKLKYLMSGIFLLLNDLYTMFSGNASP